LAERYPQGVLADDALFWAGRSAAALKEYLRAIEHYNKLPQRYPESPKLAETRFAQGDALSELGQFAGAILAFDEVIRNYPDSYLADLARGRKGDCQFTLGSEDPERYREALASYQGVLQSPQTSPDLQWQAEYKIGRCYQKLGRSEDAFEQYMKVVYGFLGHSGRKDAGAMIWFTRAAFSAAEIMEHDGRWREAVNIYKRVIEAGVPAAGDARQRIQKIRLEHWFLLE
jgi:TolA-binding protein